MLIFEHNQHATVENQGDNYICSGMFTRLLMTDKDMKTHSKYIHTCISNIHTYCTYHHLQGYNDNNYTMTAVYKDKDSIVYIHIKDTHSQREEHV